MELFIFFFLIFQFNCILFYKLGMPDHIRGLAVKVKSMTLGELSECEFCMEFWISVVQSVAYTFYMQDYLMLLYAPCCASLSFILKSFRSWQ